MISKTPRRRWPDAFYATAQLVYTLTEIPGVEEVAITVNGGPCCIFAKGRPVTKPLTRGFFAKRQGVPAE